MFFIKIFDVKKKTDIYRVGTGESKCRAIKAGTSLWDNKTKQKVDSKINGQIKYKLHK